MSRSNDGTLNWRGTFQNAPVTRFLLVSFLVVQLGLVWVGSRSSEVLFAQLGLVPARLLGGSVASEVWLPSGATLVTSLFIHGGWLHLLLNSMFFVLIAPVVEALFGSARFGVLFLLGGVIGGVFQSLASPTSIEPVIGASGAISAVFGLYVMRFGERPPSAELVSRPEWDVAIRYAIAWGALQALIGLAGLGIAVWAHLGGFFVGLATGVLGAQRDELQRG